MVSAYTDAGRVACDEEGRKYRDWNTLQKSKFLFLIQIGEGNIVKGVLLLSYLHWEIGKRRVVAEGTTWKTRPGQTSVDKKMSLTNPCFIKSSPKAKEWRGKGIGSQQKHDGKSLSRCTTVTMEDFPTGVILQTPPPRFFLLCLLHPLCYPAPPYLFCAVRYARPNLPPVPNGNPDKTYPIPK